MNFWGHVEVMRWALIRSLVVVTALAVAAFCFKEIVFDGIVLAPCASDFVTYRALCRLGDLIGIDGLCFATGSIEMININLASQLMTHISISFYLAVIIAMPYIVTEAWLFVSPALYNNERRPARFAILAFFIQFFLGLALAYFIIFPLTYNFLGNYQVSESVVNQISLNSYISTFIGMLLIMGLVFEMPVVAFFFAKIGALRGEMFKRFRKIAIVAAAVLAAFITPSTDVFTMMLVALPLYLLYEFSAVVVRKVEKKTIKGLKG
ncbi:MAG: twin-arginine translocase subunit TatC [Bacteroidales bacterium]|nr:twin-arginine translocase subunit TatC [Bacteroidales bacterium]